MSDRGYSHGLVVGKFAPLHRGHEALIAHAAGQCQRLLVLGWSEPDLAGMPAALRQDWLRLRCPQHVVHVLDAQQLAALAAAQGVQAVPPLPANAAPDAASRDFVLWLCLHLLHWPADAVFTSEDYGDGFAAHLQAGFTAALGRPHPVRHVSFDPGRAGVPISGSALRARAARGDDLRQWVAPCVNAGLVRRVCILGGESSGKSTLAQALADALRTSWVPEYGRALWEQRQGRLTEADLLAIAQEQVRREEHAASQAPGWLVCDTSPLTTLFYALEMYGRAAPALWRLAAREYHHVLLCAPDFPFVQDGTRRDPGFRDHGHAWYLRALRERGIRATLLQGTPDARLAHAVQSLGVSWHGR